MNEQHIGIVVRGKRYLTLDETCALLNVSRRTVYNWIALGKVVSACNPGGGRYIDYDSIVMTPSPREDFTSNY